MDWQTTLGLAIFIAVCGFIAYWGDLLGRRMGKKRLSLFGLRPRYTAIVTTTITGMIIAAVTIGAMVIANENMRRLVLQGNRIFRDYRVLQNQYNSARKNLTSASAELKKQQATTLKARHEAQSALKQRNRMDKERKRLDKALVEVKADLARNKSALTVAEKRLAAANADATAARSEVVKRQAEAKRLEGNIAQLRGTAATYITSLREHRVIFGSGEEIARRVIQCSDPRSKIRMQVVALLDEASKKAKEKGAAVGRGSRAVEILGKYNESTGERLPDRLTIDAVADAVASGRGSVVVIVFAIGNSVEGMPVPVEFRNFWNRKAYSAGELVAAVTIDGTLTKGRIMEQLIGFLRNDVRQAAETRGVIPLQSEDGRPTVGQIDFDQLFALADKIRAEGRKVRVRASATTDTWSADTLHLNFQLAN